MVDAHAYFSKEPGSKSGVELILLDLTQESAKSTVCRELCNSRIIDDIPVIAIIASPADRQQVLDDGTDDYLLYPVLPEEINIRLSTHLHSPLHGFSTLLEAIQQMNSDRPNHVLNRSLENLAMLFNAPSAWILFLESPSAQSVSLTSGFNLPPILARTDTALTEETLGCLKILQDNQSTVPQVIACPYLNQAAVEDTNGLTHHLSIPLYGTQPDPDSSIFYNRQLMGVLNLAYQSLPRFSRAQKRMMRILGQDIGILLEIFNLQQETQIFAMQNAFIVLLARIINERLNLNTILALTLEQTIPLLNGKAGQIWLTSAEGKQLTLTSSLSTRFFEAAPREPARHPHPPTCAWGQGFTGWIAKHGRSLQTNTPTTDPRFVPSIDGHNHSKGFSFLGVPLQHREKTIGVLSITKESHPPFSKQDTILLEGIANLTASAIANAKLMQEMETYAEQQRILYEKSQQMHQQVLQTERLATVGRLTASLSHEINNPMQVILSALALAREELNNPEEMDAYLQISGLCWNGPCAIRVTASIVRLMGRRLSANSPAPPPLLTCCCWICRWSRSMACKFWKPPENKTRT